MSSPGYPAAQISLQIPPMDGPLIFWWDSEADKSLLVGTFRYTGRPALLQRDSLSRNNLKKN
jgi:hypothetical protein